MSRSPSHAELLAMRKEVLKLRLEVQRQSLIYNSQPIRRPLATIAQLSRAKLSTPTSLGALGLAAVLLGIFAPRMGKVGRLIRTGITLYPLYQALSSTRANATPPPNTTISEKTPSSSQN